LSVCVTGGFYFSRLNYFVTGRFDFLFLFLNFVACISILVKVGAAKGGVVLLD